MEKLFNLFLINKLHPENFRFLLFNRNIHETNSKIFPLSSLFPNKEHKWKSTDESQEIRLHYNSPVAVPPASRHIFSIDLWFFFSFGRHYEESQTVIVQNSEFTSELFMLALFGYNSFFWNNLCFSSNPFIWYKVGITLTDYVKSHWQIEQTNKRLIAQ